MLILAKYVKLSFSAKVFITNYTPVRVILFLGRTLVTFRIHFTYLFFTILKVKIRRFVCPIDILSATKVNPTAPIVSISVKVCAKKPGNLITIRKGTGSG